MIVEPVSSVDPYLYYHSQGFMASQDNFSRMALSQNKNSENPDPIKEVISESDPDTVPNTVI